MMKIDFKDLKPGDCARIEGFGTSNIHYRQKLIGMGLTRGTLFRVLRKAPLGDPFYIEARGIALTLRQNEANGLCIEKIL